MKKNLHMNEGGTCGFGVQQLKLLPQTKSEGFTRDKFISIKTDRNK